MNKSVCVGGGEKINDSIDGWSMYWLILACLGNIYINLYRLYATIVVIFPWWVVKQNRLTTPLIHKTCIFF